MSRLLEPPALDALAEALQALADDPAAEDFDALPVDADASDRQDLAERMLWRTLEFRARVPELPDPNADTGGDPAMRTVDVAVDDLYNAARIDVLHRIRELRLRRS